MRKYLLASHSDFADGIKHSVELITGPHPNILTLNAYMTADFDLQYEAKALLDECTREDELIVITDVYGGSINNEFLLYLENYNYHLVCGLNLALVIELLMHETETAEKAIGCAIEASKASILYCNLLNTETDDEF